MSTHIATTLIPEHEAEWVEIRELHDGVVLGCVICKVTTYTWDPR